MYFREMWTGRVVWVQTMEERVKNNNFSCQGHETSGFTRARNF
jgi:hypothetical protein